MDDPLLSSLCTICHIDVPKYTCPRCSAQTCSLRCSKRHKIWASCNGVRDPTVYKPISEVATASGIDHDYNFLHGIETRIQRSEKVLIEDLGIVDAKELQQARTGLDADAPQKDSGFHVRGTEQLDKTLREKRIRIIKAPKGMRRNTENTTAWNRNQKCINWQVEWIRAPNNERTLYQALDKFSLGKAFDIMFEEERKLCLSPEQKRGEKSAAKRKRKVTNSTPKLAKKFKMEENTISAISILQNHTTTAWNVTPVNSRPEPAYVQPPVPRKHQEYHFYLQRPLTPASFPKVLAPLDTTKHISELLQRRDVMEFPTVYVLEESPKSLPSDFMLEKDFLRAIGQKGPRIDADTEMGDSDDSSSSSGSSDSSDSDEDSDSSEEGEISE